MESPYEPVRDLLARVRSRWRRLLLFQATVRASLAAAGVVALVLFLTHWTSRAPLALAILGLGGVVLAIGAVIWGFWPAREVPSDRRVARFIEESVPSLDERLVSAVDVAAIDNPENRPALASSMIRDAGRAASAVDPAAVLSAERLRRAGFQAVAAAMLLLAVAVAGRDTARQSLDASLLALFPSRVTIEVTPGNARVEAGRSLTIEARLVGNRAPVVAQLLRTAGDGEEWRATEMKSDAGGHFTLALDSLSNSFRYKVAAGTVTSSTFNVAVLRAPRVTRIDVEYTYPKELGLEPRVEQDGGDIYAPAGTDVRVRVHTDRHAINGRLMLGGGKAVELTTEGKDRLTGSLHVVEDTSYRVALGDADGLSSRGDTEYFIRTLEDRPPDVHVTKPASDRKVTRLEEVDIEAEAQDDFGVESLELVYSVRGGPDKRVPLNIPRRSTTVTARHTLYLEDLDVEPGDFVTYHVRARDLARGKRASETRSDIFFLEVKPFEQEFSLAQSQASMGGGSGNRQIDDLVAAQKEIIVATWKLDRRSQAARGAKSEQDIKAVARAESELKTRVEETSSGFRESNMRDPRRRPQTPGRGGQPQPGGPRAGQTLPEEDAMTAAATAMGKAVSSLEALKTAEALPPEMQALNHLLKAQADVKKRQVQRQQAGGAGGGNRSTQDMSSLFDKELARHQQTNYETPTSTERRGDQDASALDKIKELARRQDELLKRQQELARDRAAMTEEALKRELETLTRDQNELRKRAEELAQEMARQQSRNQNSQSGQPSQSGQQSPSGQQGQQGQQGQKGQAGQAGQQQGQGTNSASGQGGGGQNERQMRDISEEMRNAASGLRRQDATQATERAARALEKLRDLERQMQSSTPDARRRALGDLQLEAHQLADSQRQIASESARSGQEGVDKDVLRRLAGEEDRLADRLQRVQEGLKRQAAGGGVPGRDKGAAAKNIQQAAGEASREVDRQRLTERMREAADVMRSGGSPGSAGAQKEIARALDKLADTLASADSSGDKASMKLSGQLARAQELRERLDGLNRELEKLGQQGGQAAGGRQGNGQQPGNQQPGGQQEGQPGDSQPGKGQQSGGQNGQGSQSALSTPGQSGGSGQGQSGVNGSGRDAARLGEELNRQIQEVRELMNQLQREDPSFFTQGGAGRTFEGRGMTLSAPGTEAFKQDFAKWQQLRRQASQALEHAESALAKKLHEKESKDRLAAGVDDKPPAAYQHQVDRYFKALATRKKP